jgi:hypothetical protein
MNKMFGAFMQEIRRLSKHPTDSNSCNHSNANNNNDEINDKNDKNNNNDSCQSTPATTESTVPISNTHSYVKKPDDFTGDGLIDVDNWMHQIETYHKLAYLPEATKVNHTIMYLKEQALDWALGNEFADFKHFKKRMITRFGRKEKSLNAATALDRASQMGSVDNYAKWFQQQLNALSKVDKLNDREQVRKFRQGLKPTILRSMIGQQFDNLDDIIHRAITIEQISQEIAQKSNKRSQTQCKQHQSAGSRR